MIVHGCLNDTVIGVIIVRFIVFTSLTDRFICFYVLYVPLLAIRLSFFNNLSWVELRCNPYRDILLILLSYNTFHCIISTVSSDTAFQ